MGRRVELPQNSLSVVPIPVRAGTELIVRILGGRPVALLLRRATQLALAVFHRQVAARTVTQGRHVPRARSVMRSTVPADGAQWTI